MESTPASRRRTRSRDRWRRGAIARRRRHTPRAPCRAGDTAVGEGAARATLQSYANLLRSRRTRVGAREHRSHDFIEKLVDLLRRATDEAAGLQGPLEVGHREAERGVGCEPLEQIVPGGAVLERARRFETMLTNALVRRLAVAPGAHRASDQLFGRQEG